MCRFLLLVLPALIVALTVAVVARSSSAASDCLVVEDFKKAAVGGVSARLERAEGRGQGDLSRPGGGRAVVPARGGQEARDPGGKTDGANQGAVPTDPRARS